MSEVKLTCDACGNDAEDDATSHPVDDKPATVCKACGNLRYPGVIAAVRKRRLPRHLFEFESSGYYAAPDRESAIEAVMKNIGYDRKDAEDDFRREVPDDELITATSDDSWNHVNQREEARALFDRTLTIYSLELTAGEHAALAPAWGYCFGGEE
jgi:hypothetical protein